MRRLPPAVVMTVALLGFLGLTAAAGGAALLAGGAMTPPDEWLAAIPLIGAWTVPGLVLLAGFGAGSLVTAYGVLRRTRWSVLAPVERVTGQHWSWTATILLGLGQIIWIALELIYLPRVSFLQPGYALVGLALALLPSHRQVRAHLAPGLPALPATAPAGLPSARRENRDEDVDGGRCDDPAGGHGGADRRLPQPGGPPDRDAAERRAGR